MPTVGHGSGQPRAGSTPAPPPFKFPENRSHETTMLAWQVHQLNEQTGERKMIAQTTFVRPSSLHEIVDWAEEIHQEHELPDGFRWTLEDEHSLNFMSHKQIAGQSKP